MKVVRYPAPQAFLDAAEPFLLADEARNNLLLGVPARLNARGPDAARGVYLATAVDGDDVVAAAMMTPPWRLVLSAAARPGAIGRLAEDVATVQPAPPGVEAEDAIAGEFVAVWRRLTGEESKPTVHERIHRLDDVRPLPPVPGRLRPAADADRPLLVDWLQAFADEAFAEDPRPGDANTLIDARLGTPGEGFVFWEDTGPRCLTGYGGGTKHGIRIGPVYTPPEHRNRGYGTACVAEISRQLLARGRRFCMLYTDLANPQSNRIYRRIGYEPLCDVLAYRFIR